MPDKEKYDRQKNIPHQKRNIEKLSKTILPENRERGFCAYISLLLLYRLLNFNKCIFCDKKIKHYKMNIVIGQK